MEATLLCGHARQQGSPVKTNLEPGWIKQVPLGSGADEAAAVASVLSYGGGAIRFADLVEAIATLFGNSRSGIPVETRVADGAARRRQCEARSAARAPSVVERNCPASPA